jgi:hypothetical protein
MPAKVKLRSNPQFYSDNISYMTLYDTNVIIKIYNQTNMWAITHILYVNIIQNISIYSSYIISYIYIYMEA